MPSLNSAGLVALHAEVDRAFRFFNARYWGGRLPTPVFAFFRQPPNGRRLGHYCARSWRAPDGSLHDEVILYADLALERGILEVLTTLHPEPSPHFAHSTPTTWVNSACSSINSANLSSSGLSSVSFIIGICA